VANVAALWVMLWRRGHFVVDRQLARRLPRMLLASAAMGLVLVLATPVWQASEAVRGLRWPVLAGLIGLGLATYFVVGWGLGAFRPDELRAALRRRRA
jgi:putative peptidoglycan lipid II flippase